MYGWTLIPEKSFISRENKRKKICYQFPSKVLLGQETNEGKGKGKEKKGKKKGKKGWKHYLSIYILKKKSSPNVPLAQGWHKWQGYAFCCKIFSCETQRIRVLFPPSTKVLQGKACSSFIAFHQSLVPVIIKGRFSAFFSPWEKLGSAVTVFATS